jgi:hypothetical protein
MLFRRTRPFDVRQALIGAARKRYKNDGWMGPEFVEWLLHAMPVILEKSHISSGASSPELDVIRLKMLDEIRRHNRRHLRSHHSVLAGRLRRELSTCLNYDPDDVTLSYVDLLLVSTVLAAVNSFSEYGPVEADETLLIGLQMAKELIQFAQSSDSLEPIKYASKSGTSPHLAERYASIAARQLNVGEVILNAGASYVPAHGSTGDGTLLLTDQRVIFIFDEDFNKDPLIFKREHIKKFEFLPTTAVPMSEEFHLEFTKEGQLERVTFYVGRFFAAEIRLLLAL